MLSGKAIKIDRINIRREALDICFNMSVSPTVESSVNFLSICDCGETATQLEKKKNRLSNPQKNSKELQST
jgi:hypothetical protein